MSVNLRKRITIKVKSTISLAHSKGHFYWSTKYNGIFRKVGVLLSRLFTLTHFSAMYPLSTNTRNTIRVINLRDSWYC